MHLPPPLPAHLQATTGLLLKTGRARNAPSHWPALRVRRSYGGHAVNHTHLPRNLRGPGLRRYRRYSAVPSRIFFLMSGLAFT